LKDAKELGTVKVFKMRKVTKEFMQESARSAEEDREQSKSQGEIVLGVQEGRGLYEVLETVKSSIIGRIHMVEDQEIWELELQEFFQEQTEIFSKSRRAV
jgi:hypothetical protein